MSSRLSPGAMVGAILGGLVLGLLVGTFGTLAHRQWAPWMLVAALVATLSGAVWMRSWHGVPAAVPYAVGWGVATQLLAGTGPGGNALVPAETIGYVWVYGGILAALVVLVMPSRWFRPRAATEPTTSAP